MPKYVVSSTLRNPERNNSTVLEGDPVEAVRRLKDNVDGVLLVAGSARPAQTLLGHDLVDEIRLMVFPVGLGSGKRLFGETADRKPLKLTESRTVGDDGVAVMVYARAAPRR